MSNTVYMEPIDGVEHISKNRWRLVSVATHITRSATITNSCEPQICYLCRKRVGACIQCANRNCFAAFHVTCARDFGLELKMKQGNERGELRAYCEKHGEVGSPWKEDRMRRQALLLTRRFGFACDAVKL